MILRYISQGSCAEMHDSNTKKIKKSLRRKNLPLKRKSHRLGNRVFLSTPKLTDSTLSKVNLGNSTRNLLWEHTKLTKICGTKKLLIYYLQIFDFLCQFLY